ncbi:MAG: beta-lactamase family protein [Chitinophagaceae bacterium]|nr:beta-lactamase family protein [Chitinophagaceae bacterium]
MKFLVYILTVVCFPLLIAAQQTTGKQLEKKLDNFLSTEIKSSEPGYQVLIAKSGQVIYNKAFGLADLELGVPIKADMVFNLASVTKQFTAVAILQLVEQGKISLSDSLQKFIPDYPFKVGIITIENLLTHTSGIKDYLQIAFPTPFLERWDFAPKQLIDSFKYHPLEFMPGTKYSYSNSGYFLLGYIIEKVSGKSYQQYIRENLLTSAGLANSNFDWDNHIIPGRVKGYVKADASFKNINYMSPSIQYAAGGLISNVEDLYTWHKALYSYRLLKKESLEKAFSPFRLKDGSVTNYGYGWNINTYNGIKVIEHQGALPGFSAQVMYFPDDDVFMAILCNNGGISINKIVNNVAALVLNKPLQADIRLSEKEFDSYAGTYQLVNNPGRTAKLYKMNGSLVAEVTNAELLLILFQSPTKFQFKNLPDANCEFILENGKVTKFTVTQNGYFEWRRIE